MANRGTTTGCSYQHRSYRLRLVICSLMAVGGVCVADAQVPPGFTVPQNATPMPGQVPAPGQPPADPGQAAGTSGQPAGKPAQEMVVDVLVCGNKTVALDKILKEIKTRKGRPFDLEMIEEDVRRLDNTHLFFNVKTYTQQVAGGKNVYFEVFERPLLTDILFLGNYELHKNSLHRECGIKKGDAVDPYVIEGARCKLEEYYRSKGFSQARIVLFEGDKPEDRRAIFLINEGTKKKVWDIKFVGNTIASGGRLKTVVSSKTPFLGLFGGEFDAKKIIEDRDKLFAYYRGLGFFQARIGAAPPVYNEKGNWVTLEFVIDEGPRSAIRNISVEGNCKYSSEELLGLLKLKKGEYYNQDKLNSDKLTLVDKYGHIGYVFANIEPDVRLLEEPGRLDLIYHIKEGKPYRFGKIDVAIKDEYPHTRLTTVLERLSIVPGDIIDTREMRESERRLKISSIFEGNPATGSPPKIAFDSPDQLGEGKTEMAEKPDTADTPPRRSGFRGQSPDPPPRNAWYAPSTNSQSLQDGGGSRNASDRLTNSLNQLVAVLPKNQNTQRMPTGLVLTQYTPDSGESTPSVQRSQLPWTNAQTTSSGANGGASTAYAGGQAVAQANVGPQQQLAASDAAATQTSAPNAQAATATQPATVQPAAPYGQPYPGIILSPDSPFNGGSPDGGMDALPLTTHVFTQGAMTGRIQLGVGVNSDSGLVGTVMLDEQNFDWSKFPTSWEDFRNGTAFRGNGQRFNITAAPGTTTQRYSVTFQDPYVFESLYSLSLSGYYYNRIYTEYYDQRLGGRIAIGKLLTHDLSATLAYSGAKVNISNPIDPALPDLKAVVGRDLAMHSFQGLLALDKRDNSFLATQGYYLEGSFQETLGSYNYPRAELDARKYFTLFERPDGSGRQVLALSSHAGWTGDNTPIYDRWYDGGFTTIRGFAFRGVSPTEIGPTTNAPIIVGGDFEVRASAEYLFPITADDMLRAVVFCDTGTVEPSIKSWTDKFRVAPGFGLRITVPAMQAAPIALDFAFPVSWQKTDKQEVFSFFMGFQR